MIGMDFTNQKIGSLFVISSTDKRSTSGKVWSAICECGNNVLVSSGSLRRTLREGYKTGCGKCKHSQRRHNADKNETAFYTLYGSYKSSAKLRGLDFLLTEDEFKKLTSGDCIYCNDTPSKLFFTENKDGHYKYNGIDRVDPKLGYVLNNCVSACTECNLMKQSLTKDDFIKKVKKIYKTYTENEHQEDY
jgi:hypothetical protein